MTERTFTTPSGVEIAYEERGGGGEPLVLVHGWTGFRGDFATEWDALAEDRRVLVPDLRGHGRSSHLGNPEAYTFDALVEDLSAFLGAVAAGPCHLLGHSMGGMAALRIALEAPERLASLILMDTSAAPLGHVNPDAVKMAGKIAREQGMEVLSQLLRKLESESSERSRASLAHEAASGERYWEWRAARIRQLDPFAYEAFVHAMIEQESVVPRLGEIGVPALVVVGSQDRAFLRPSGVLAAGIPDAWCMQIAGAAHQPQLESPRAWREALRVHLARVEDR